MSELKCIIKGCQNKKHEDKYYCEKHWKERRKKNSYKYKRGG